MLPRVYWWAAAGALGGYLLLFAVARRPVSLRLSRVGAILAAAVALRLGISPLVGLPEGPGEWALLAGVGLVGLALGLARRVWLVRATAEDLRRQIETACRGLFLGVGEKQPGRLTLTARGDPVLKVRRWTARVQGLVLCRPPGPGKVALLCAWLGKQYPGPVPRVRIVLKGGAT
jgi:hypothetical protein